MITDDVPYIWTSGRLCDFKGCESRKDLEPKNILGWFWSANREKISPTNSVSPQAKLLLDIAFSINYFGYLQPSLSMKYEGKLMTGQKKLSRVSSSLMVDID